MKDIHLKTISTLIDDVYDLVFKGKKASQENLELLGKGVVESVGKALEQGCKVNPPTLRMSNIGTPNRKLWYTLKNYKVDPIAPTQAIAFMYGHMIEQLLLFLAREAGHTVTDEQKEVELDGIVGHLDCKIDGVLVDVKGMSNFGFKKFISGAFMQQDSFGYIPQISGYAQAEKSDAGAFFVYNKERGTLCLFILEEMDLINAKARIAEVRKMLESDTPPQRCYQPVPQSKTSPNLKLDRPCEWCPFKKECWKDANNGQGLRAFQYYGGVEYLVKIETEPRVEEIFENLNEKTTEEEIQVEV